MSQIRLSGRIRTLLLILFGAVGLLALAGGTFHAAVTYSRIDLFLAGAILGLIGLLAIFSALVAFVFWRRGLTQRTVARPAGASLR